MFLIILKKVKIKIYFLGCSYLRDTMIAVPFQCSALGLRVYLILTTPYGVKSRLVPMAGTLLAGTPVLPPDKNTTTLTSLPVSISDARHWM